MEILSTSEIGVQNSVATHFLMYHLRILTSNVTQLAIHMNDTWSYWFSVGEVGLLANRLLLNMIIWLEWRFVVCSMIDWSIDRLSDLIDLFIYRNNI
jgi:hypothetical protein